MSPLFLSIAGCPVEESFLPPKTELAMIEGLLAHPQIDPNLGFSRWGDTPDGCFTRKSPLMAALVRLLLDPSKAARLPSSSILLRILEATALLLNLAAFYLIIMAASCPSL